MGKQLFSRKLHEKEEIYGVFTLPDTVTDAVLCSITCRTIHIRPAPTPIKCRIVVCVGNSVGISDGSV